MGGEVRYVIDNYSAPPEPDGSPVFSLDVRPALDSFGSLKERTTFATEEVWASFRERKQVKPSESIATQSMTMTTLNSPELLALDAFLVVAKVSW